MKGIKILHCADLHIGAALSSLGPLSSVRNAEVLFTLGKIVALCKSEQVRLLLIAGDLFDSFSVSDETIKTIKDYFATIKETTVAIVPGNHDYLNADSPYNEDFGENVHIFKKSESIEVDGVCIYGIPFLSAYSDTFCLPRFTEGGILLMHGDLDGGNYNPITEELLEKTGASYVALGHVHKFSGIKSVGKTRYCYPGCPEPLGFDELGEKGVVIGTVGEGCSLSFLPVCKRQYKEITLNISECEDTGDVLAKAKSLLSGEKENLIKLILDGECSFEPDCQLILTALENEAFYIKLRNETSPKENLDILKNEQSLKGIFVKKMLLLAEKASPDEKEKILKSLRLGLKAFDKREVGNDDN